MAVHPETIEDSRAPGPDPVDDPGVPNLARAVCRGLLSCGPGYAPLRSEHECLRFPEVAGTQPFWHPITLGQNLSPEAHRACAALVERGCPVVPLASAFWVPTGQGGVFGQCAEFFASRTARVGEECDYDSDCEPSAYCASSETAECGSPRCRQRIEPGAPCTHTRQCRHRSGEYAYCLPTTRLDQWAHPGLTSSTCVDVTVAEPASESSWCGWSRTAGDTATVTPCSAELVCFRGTCARMAPYPETLRGQRELGQACVDSTFCDYTRKYACVDGQCAEWGKGKAGDPCMPGVVECSEGFWCDLSTCRESLPAGALCVQPWDRVPFHAATHALSSRCATHCCDTHTRQCVMPPAEGSGPAVPSLPSSLSSP